MTTHAETQGPDSGTKRMPQLKVSRHPRTSTLVAAVIVIVAVLPPVLLHTVAATPYYLTIATLVLVYAIVAVTLNAPIRTGYWPAGQSAFMAAGGYATAILTTRTGLPTIVGLLAGAILGGLLAFIVGRMTIRLNGVYFVLGTFAFAEVVRLTIVNNTSFLGGPSGIAGVAPFTFATKIFDLSANDGRLLSTYYIALAVLLLGIVVLSLVYRSSIGAVFDAMNANIRLVESHGVEVVNYRVFAFTLSGVFAGMGGSLLVVHLGLASPDMFEFMLSIDVLIMNIVGGTRRIIGPLIGAVLLTPLPELLRGSGAIYAQIAYGAIVVLIILALPGGLISLRRRRELRA